MKMSVAISCAVFFLVSSVAAEDFFFTQNRTPTGITGGLVIKNFQGEVVKELADVASDFNILHFDPLRRIVMGTDELTEGDDWDGNRTNVNRMSIDGEFLGEKQYAGDLTRAFAVDPVDGLLYASDEQFTVVSYLKSGSAGKYTAQPSRDSTAIAGIGLPEQSGSLFLFGYSLGANYRYLSKIDPENYSGFLFFGTYISSDTQLAIDASNQRLYVLGTPESTRVRELISMNLDGGNQITHVVGSEVPAGNRIEVDSHGGYLYLSGGSELHRMPLMGNQIETVCTDCIVGGAFALISVAGLHRPGDADMDNDVDLSDYNTLAENFGSGGRNWYDANFDGDQSVDLGDYNLLATNFAPGGYDKMSFLNSSSTTGEPLATVPEPSAHILATLGLLVWMCFSCRVPRFRFAACA